ncbi:MAG: hypothetical protein JKY48_08465 [Flavobacteriales bacterium]|nr:hypothetical protein [Flavobacteriales bacterium]
MKNTLFGILLGIILYSGFQFINSFRKHQETISLKTALIIIKNDSDFRVTNVTLKHGYGELNLSNIEIGRTAYLGFYNSSENDYSLIVKLENDSILKSGCGYFEYGLRAIETITNTKITHEDNW